MVDGRECRYDEYVGSMNCGIWEQEERYSYDEMDRRYESNNEEYGAGGRLIRRGDVEYRYNENGEVKEIIDYANLEIRVLSWDIYGRLREVEIGGCEDEAGCSRLEINNIEKTIRYYYDGLGRRIGKEIEMADGSRHLPKILCKAGIEQKGSSEGIFEDSQKKRLVVTERGKIFQSFSRE